MRSGRAVRNSIVVAGGLLAGQLFCGLPSAEAGYGLMKGKNAVISGAGSGIGQAVALKFANEGINKIGIFGRRAPELEESAKGIQKVMDDIGMGGKVFFFPGIDVSNSQNLFTLQRNIKDNLGEVHVLVNNAGVSGPVKAFPRQPKDGFRDAVHIHLNGTWQLSNLMVPLMKAGSKIINLATFFAPRINYEQRPYRYRTPYTAAQGAKNRLTEVLAEDLFDKVISVIDLNPGPVESERIHGTVYPKGAAENIVTRGEPVFTTAQLDHAFDIGLPALAESKGQVSSEKIQELANELVKRDESFASIPNLPEALDALLKKNTKLAQGIQQGTKDMITNREFLSQDDVAQMVTTYASDLFNHSSGSQRSMVNGGIVANDTIKYHLNNGPHVGTVVDGISEAESLSGKHVVVVSEKDTPQSGAAGRAARILKQKHGAEITRVDESIERLTNEEKLFSIDGTLAGLVYFTGTPELSADWSALSREDIDLFSKRYIEGPANLLQQGLFAMAPGGKQDIKNFKKSVGELLLVGPSYPSGKVPSSHLVKVEMATEPGRALTSTIGMELKNNLSSNIQMHMISPGRLDGKLDPNAADYVDKLDHAIPAILAGTVDHRNERIHMIDNGR